MSCKALTKISFSKTSFRSSKITVLNIGSTPPYAVLKSTSENQIFFYFKTSSLSFSLFNVFLKVQQIKLNAECFSVVLKIAKTHKKLRELHRFCLT